jgi:hypothetical protein
MLHTKIYQNQLFVYNKDGTINNLGYVVGPTGATGAGVPGPPGPPGVGLVSCDENNHTLVWSNGLVTPLAPGPPGPVGSTGATGMRGRGEKGSTGPSGARGVSVDSVRLDGDGSQIVFGMSDGTAHRIPSVRGPTGVGVSSVSSMGTELVFKLSDNTTHAVPIPVHVGPTGAAAIIESIHVDASNRVVTTTSDGRRLVSKGYAACAPTGPQGVGVAAMHADADGSALAITLTDNKTHTFPLPRGPAGQDGTDGVGIRDITSSGLLLTIELTNNKTYTFTLPRGRSGKDGPTGPAAVFEPRVISNLGIEHAPVYFDVSTGDFCLLSIP